MSMRTNKRKLQQRITGRIVLAISEPINGVVKVYSSIGRRPLHVPLEDIPLLVNVLGTIGRSDKAPKTLLLDPSL